MLQDSITNIFGMEARAENIEFISSPLDATPNYFIFGWGGYTIMAFFLISLSLLFYYYRLEIKDIIGCAFSESRLFRRVKDINRSLDNVSRCAIIIMLLFAPFYIASNPIFLSNIKEYLNIDINNTLLSIALSLSLAIYLTLIRFSISAVQRKKKTRKLFYRQLFICERITVAAYTITLSPLLLIITQDLPYKILLLKITSVIIVIAYLHNIITISKFFIHENVSYLRWILYLCILKGVYAISLIYFAITALNL